ncbi:MAG TPA: DotH/IcmK family type IV secretion protein [Gammaproteobacteria bacterium]|nr:DotH/IcmK family type IV secretion protein [Gammaproteobacteria bacterium]
MSLFKTTVGAFFLLALQSTASVYAADASPLPSTVKEFQQWLKDNPNAKWRQPAKPAAKVKPAAVSRLSSNTSSGDDQVIEKPISYEEGQQIMLNSVPKVGSSPSAESQVAFNAMMAQNMPMSPDQVVKMRQQVDLAQRAAAVPANIPPKPVSSTIMVNLAPGTTPPAVRLAQGYVTSLVFVDSTGQPWPIASFDIGNPKAVTMQWDGKSNVLLMQALTPYTTGDMVVRLVGLPTPITLEMIAGQRVVDYRVDLHVSGIGPNTKDLPLGTNLPNSANQLLLGVLDGLAPAGSKALTVTGADSQAWMLGEKMYLRTRLTVLSPGWVGKMVSPDGMIAYELPKTSSVLVSKFGEPAEIKIEGF